MSLVFIFVEIRQNDINAISVGVRIEMGDEETDEFRVAVQPKFRFIRVIFFAIILPLNTVKQLVFDEFLEKSSFKSQKYSAHLTLL